MPWETFDPVRHGRRPAKVPYVTIDPKLRLTLNEPAMEALGRPRRVSLLFDPKANVLGLRPADRCDRTAFLIGPKIHHVSVAGLFGHYGLTVDDDARRRPAEMVDGVLCVNLTDEGTVVTRRRTEIASRSGE